MHQCCRHPEDALSDLIPAEVVCDFDLFGGLSSSQGWLKGRELNIQRWALCVSGLNRHYPAALPRMECRRPEVVSEEWCVVGGKKSSTDTKTKVTLWLLITVENRLAESILCHSIIFHTCSLICNLPFQWSASTVHAAADSYWCWVSYCLSDELFQCCHHLRWRAWHVNVAPAWRCSGCKWAPAVMKHFVLTSV